MANTVMHHLHSVNFFYCFYVFQFMANRHCKGKAEAVVVYCIHYNRFQLSFAATFFCYTPVLRNIAMVLSFVARSHKQRLVHICEKIVLLFVFHYQLYICILCVPCKSIVISKIICMKIRRIRFFILSLTSKCSFYLFIIVCLSFYLSHRPTAPLENEFLDKEVSFTVSA